MAYFVFVDNSNVWIEGKFVSAVKKGWANSVPEAHHYVIQDNAWRIDFGKLLDLVTDGHATEVTHAILYGSTPPKNDSLWNAMRAAQFEVSTLDRSVANKEKAIDTSIVHQIDKCLYCEADEGDIFVLVMGDKDFLPSVEAIREKNCVARIAFWNQASGELTSEADEFLDLTDHIEEISY